MLLIQYHYTAFSLTMNPNGSQPPYRCIPVIIEWTRPEDIKGILRNLSSSLEIQLRSTCAGICESVVLLNAYKA